MKRVRVEAEKCEYTSKTGRIKNNLYVVLTMKACKQKKSVKLKQKTKQTMLPVNKY